MKRFVKILLIAALIAGAVGATFCITYQELSAAMMPTPIMAKVNEIEQYLDYYFIDPYDETTVADGAAAGMVAATGDEWSHYISANDFDRYQEQKQNAYVGIGVTIQLDEAVGGFVITSVTPGGPAAEAGIRVGDVLLKVEDAIALELGQTETVNRVRGEAGTEVRMTFVRDGEPFEVTMVRTSIVTAVATYEITDDNIAIIKIANFDEHCADESIAAIEAVLEQGVSAIIFDVRNNPGGFKTEMVRVLDYLLPEGVLFRSVDFEGKEEQDMSDAACVHLPMAVLVNQESYSAAEFFAAAMQEYDAAVIVGTQTYGKGNFQNTFRLSDGSAIALSIGKYFTPNGVSLTGVGITPDVEVSLSDEQAALLYLEQLPIADDPQMQAALDAVR